MKTNRRTGLSGTLLVVVLGWAGAACTSGTSAAPDESPAELVEEETVFVYEDDRFETAWFESPDGLFRIALPQSVDLLDVEISDDEWIQMDDREELNLLAHTEDPDGVPLRGRIVLATQKIEEPLERSEYQERFVQTFWHDALFEDRDDRGAEFAGLASPLWDRSWYFRPRARDQELRRVLYRAVLWQLEVDEMVWSFAVIAPEDHQELFVSLFLQALETLEML